MNYQGKFQSGVVLLSVFVAGALAACDGPQVGGAFQSDKTVQVEGLPPLTMHFRGPRLLTDEEMARATPQARPIQSVAQATVTAAATPAPGKTTETMDEATLVDLSGFTVSSNLGGEEAQSLPPTTEGVGQVSQALSGPVTPTFFSFTGFIAQGASATYQFVAPISVGILMPSSGDADLYMEECNGTRIASATAGSTTTDFGDIYQAGGAATCRQFRVYGYRASNYRLAVFNYR